MANQPAPHGGSFVPQTASPTQQYSVSSSLPPKNPHGGNYVPGQTASPYTGAQPSPQGVPHGGNYIPGQGPQPSNSYQANPGQFYSPPPQISPAPLNGQYGHNPGVDYTNNVGQQQSMSNEKSLTVTSDEVSQRPRNPQRTQQTGYQNLTHSAARWRWKWPNSFQMPGYIYDMLEERRHKDVMQRVWKGAVDDRYMSPWDGHVAKLVVQATDEVYHAPNYVTWRRTFVRNVSPIMLRLANWPMSKVTVDATQWTDEEWTSVCLKWLPACVALMAVMTYPTIAEGQIRNNGYYDAIPHKWWGHAKAARNPCEQSNPRQLTLKPNERTNPISERLLRPRYLCFLKNPEDSESHGIEPMKVDQWISLHGADADMNYLFIAYTAEQFHSNADLEALHHIAERATRDAGLPAYWVGCSCMADPDELEEDVYRISDVMRGAQDLVIVVGAPSGTETVKTTQHLLKVWGERMWTLPEALLSPGGRDILVYTRGQSLSRPLRVSKKNFAALTWDDAAVTRQLIDHYEGSLILSRLELVILALQCLNNRRTSQYFQGDLSYALMGLLRLRPNVDSSDSAFQAFARLSLANDSDMLLERLICTLPRNPAQSVLSTDDAWGVGLWDIYPSCQVAGIGHDDAVIIDGAFGATIRWKAFALVANAVRDSWRRLIARTCLRGSPFLFYVGIGLLAAPGYASLQAVGGIFLALALIFVLLSPYLIRLIYSGKLWGTQAWFFGFEGYMDIETIESNIFGAYFGHLTWTPHGSPLSRHRIDEYGELIGLDPTTDPGVKELVQRANGSMYGQPKVFTLVDTYQMTVTMFEAVNPPVAVVLCGSEGGMQRAVMCSYDWTTQTFYRETVLRMETLVLEKLSRVGRFRFGMKRPVLGARPV